MDNILRSEPTGEETTQMRAEINQKIAEVKQIRESMRRDDKEIEALQSSTQATLDAIKAMIEKWRK